MGNIVIIGIVTVLFMLRNFVRSLLMLKPVWYFITCFAFVLCIGGTAYNMIHGVPPWKYAQDPNSG